MNLRLPDPTGHVDIGDSALVRLSVDEVLDPLTGAVIQAAIPSHVQALLHALRSAFGEAEQLQAIKALEVFFEFRRGRLPIPEWIVQWELNLEEAVTHAGLEVNQVAKTYLYLKSSQLGQRARSQSMIFEEPADAEEDTSAAPSNNMDESYYQGKGKSRTGSMGLGCSTCGSKWHNTHSCPLNSQQQSKGHGKSKGFGKPKGFGKNFGRPMRKGFGKGKYKGYGKGKGKPYKGYGKRSFWSDDLPQGFGEYYGGSYLMNGQSEPFHFKDGASTFPSRTSIIKMDSPEKEEILFKKKVKFEEHPPGEDQG